MGETSSCLVADDELACPAPSVVPEPSMVVLFLLVLAYLAMCVAGGPRGKGGTSDGY